MQEIKNWNWELSSLADMVTDGSMEDDRKVKRRVGKNL